MSNKRTDLNIFGLNSGKKPLENHGSLFCPWCSSLRKISWKTEEDGEVTASAFCSNCKVQLVITSEPFGG